MNILDWLYTQKKIYWWNITSNRYYGHLHILKKYCNKKITCGIPGLLQHGWTSASGVYIGARKDLPYTFFVWNERNYNIAQKLGYHNTKIIGAPFLYQDLDLFSAVNNHKNENNLLLFPIHSTEYERLLDPVSYFNGYVREIGKLKREFDNINACLYFIDYNNPHIRKVFENANIGVTTLGSRQYNPEFLIKFVKLVNNFKFVSSNVLSTAIFYSLYLGKKVFVYGKQPEIGETNWNAETQKIMDDCLTILGMYPLLNWENFDNKSHREIGEIELGSKFKKSEAALINIFGW